MSNHRPPRKRTKPGGWLRRRRLGFWMRRAERLGLRGDHVAAFRCYARAALAGGVQGQAILGNSYLHGHGVPANIGAASLWYERAASGGDTHSMVQLARLALAGRPGTDPFNPVASTGADHLGCHAWALRAADAGSAEAKVILASLLLDGPSAIRDAARAGVLLREAAEQGNASGQLGLALLLARDAPGAHRADITRLIGTAAAAGLPLALYLDGVTRELDPGAGHDRGTVVDCYRRAAERGIRAAQTRLGRMLLEGAGVGHDAVAGETFLRKAALAGDAVAAALVGQIYVRTGKLPANYAEASLWFGRAAQNGHRGAAAALGLMHLTGMGVAPDDREAARWFQLARNTTDPASFGDLAHLLFPASDAPERHLDIRAWFAEATAAGEASAAYRLGVCFLLGIGGDRDAASAAALLRRAADRLPAAGFLYGQMLSLGQGIDRDEVEARRWLSQAAGSGVADARALLAEMYFNGRGGAQDEAGARGLFSQAVAQHHPGATFALGVLFTGQHRTPEDADRATQLLTRAIELGHPHAAAALHRYRSRRPANASATQDAVPA